MAKFPWGRYRIHKLLIFVLTKLFKGHFEISSVVNPDWFILDPDTAFQIILYLKPWQGLTQELEQVKKNLKIHKKV